MNTPAAPKPVETSAPAWTQDEAVAFESARECITDWISVLISQIHQELSQTTADARRISELEDECTRLHAERSGLRVGDADRIAYVRAKYGTLVRQWRSVHAAELPSAMPAAPDEDDFMNPTAEQRLAMARIGSRPGAVGYDNHERLVRVRADGTFEVLQG